MNENHSNSPNKFDKKAYNKKYLEKHKDKYHEMSRNRSKERYYTDVEFRTKIIERAKISETNKRMAMKNMPDPNLIICNEIIIYF